MQKSFTLWRLPPVLIIQLKRFQFDRTNRRKLNNHIEFPIENLDVFDYLATSRQRSLSGDAAVDLTGGTGTTTSGMGRPPVAPSGRLTGRLASQADDYGAATQPQVRSICCSGNVAIMSG